VGLRPSATGQFELSLHLELEVSSVDSGENIIHGCTKLHAAVKINCGLLNHTTFGNEIVEGDLCPEPSIVIAKRQII
jgi:hypothetical protein